MDEKTLSLMRLLLARLERVSVDSYWAHRASGIRGVILEILEENEAGIFIERQKAEKAIEYGYKILLAAAREKQIPR